MATKKSEYSPQPPIPESGYSFIAAGNTYNKFGGLCAYVKFKGGDKHHIKVKDLTRNHLWVQCPDREIVLVQNGQDMHSFYPYGESFDYFIDFSTFNDYATSAMGIEYVMTNYTHQGPTVMPRTGSKIQQDRRVQMLSDSGGLQLIRGQRDLINPIDLMEFYNNNVDAGMVLDLPLWFSDPKVAARAAKIQKRSNEVMLKHSRGVELINIFHGYTREEYNAYRGVVETPEIKRMAIGGLMRRDYTAGCSDIYDVTDSGPFRYKQHHMLGVYMSGYIPLFVKMANSGVMPHITSDSTSHIQSGANKAYHIQPDMYNNMKRIPIGSRASIPNTQRFLHCQCPVCKTIKYTDVLGFLSNEMCNTLLALHNAIEMARYARSLQEVMLQASSREYNQLIHQQLKHHGELHSVKMALDFVDTKNAHGLKAARKKYSAHLYAKRLSSEETTGSLFETETKEEGDALRSTTLKCLKNLDICLKEIE